METILIYPFWSLIANSTFAILIANIKTTKQITTEDRKGLRWFIIAFSLWAAISFFAIILHPDNQYFQIFEIIVSTLNSYFFIRAVSFIEINGHYRGQSFVNDITKKSMLLFFTISIIFYTLVFSFALIILKVNGSVYEFFIRFPDFSFSMFSISVFGMVIRKAYQERKMQQFNWLIFVTLFLLLAMQLYHLINLDPPLFNKNYLFINSLVIVTAIIFKTFLFILVILLIYSYQIQKLGDLSNSMAILDLQYIKSEAEKMQLTKENQTIQAQMIVKQEELQILKNEIMNGNVSIHEKIEFYFRKDQLGNDQLGIIITPKFTKDKIEINFLPNLDAFKRLLRMAIHRKYGQNEKEQTMILNDATKEEIDGKLYESQISYKQKETIKVCTERKYADFISTFLIEIKSIKPHTRIGFKIPAENILIPPRLPNKNGITPDQIYDDYLNEYVVLQKERYTPKNKPEKPEQ